MPIDLLVKLQPIPVQLQLARTHSAGVIALLMTACCRAAFQQLASTVAVLTNTLRKAGTHTKINMDRALQVRLHE